CVSVALLAAVALQHRRGGTLPSRGRVSVDRGHVSAAVRSERYFRRGTQSAGAGFAPLSRFWRTADGWVRTHANYPWHRAAMLRTLKTAEDPDAVAAALAGMSAEDVEEQVLAAGGVAIAVRPLPTWQAHPQGRALASEPLVGHQLIGDAPPRSRPAGALPATGVRVLDLTRVIAGPVGTRFLAALGAEVLRLDPPQRPDMKVGAVADTLLGKYSARLDLDEENGRATLDGLLADADVIVCGYRPGALDRFGLNPTTLAERDPGAVVVYLDAWGHTGPWASRRGFDSVVQAPTGIAMAESNTGAEPGALPCQLLDHGTGYLAAAAVLDGLSRQSESGGTHVRRLSLARTAWWLTSSKPGEEQSAAANPASAPSSPPWLTDLDSADGPVTAVTPPGTLDAQPLRWPFPLTGYGNDPPAWTSI
ncbi:MAG TPA: CoA transferase, partial [Acidimicrobiales bacterium]|nr:CoA transferase [Acidimicrobiales bacterium]